MVCAGTTPGDFGVKARDVGLVFAVISGGNVQCRGHNWVSLTEKAVKYLIDQEAFINKRFAHTSCGDEMYKHSLIISNPELKKNIFDMDDGVHSCMRFIDFKRANIEQQRRGEPYTWQDGDEAELLSSEYLFARLLYLHLAHDLKSLFRQFCQFHQ